MILKGKIVIITGASSGIGKAMAYEFASRGANLILGARQFVICELADSLEKQYGIQASAVQCDVSVEQDCQVLIQARRS